MTGGENDQDAFKILVLSQHFWPETFRINDFIDHIRAAGAEVTVLTGQPNYPKGKVFDGYRWNGCAIEMHPHGYEIARVPLFPRGRGTHVGMALNYLSFIAAGIAFGGRLLKDRRFDAIFVYGTSPILQGFVGVALKRRHRSKLVLWVQDLWPSALAGTGYVSGRWILMGVDAVVRALYRRADLILGQSDGFTGVLTKQAGGVPVETFPNPGDVDHSMLGPLVEHSEDGFELVFAGNLGRAQALATLADAAELLLDDSDVKITLYGTGAMEDWLQKRIADRCLTNLRLAGSRPPTEMPAILARASGALLTLVDDEMLGLTLPSKLQSYLGAGVPVIAAAGSEAQRVVSEAGAGVVCQPENAAALAGAIRQFRALAATERMAMRANARAYYSRHYEPQELATRLVLRLRQLSGASGAST